MRLLLLLLLPACIVFNPQSNRIESSFFERAWAVDADVAAMIPTPAFQKRRGFTKHDELMAFLERAAAEHPELVTLTSIGESQRGRSIPMIRLAGADPKIRVYLQGGLHGNEPASTEGLLYLVHQLLLEPELLDTVDVAIVPMANPDGYQRQVRGAANGLDLNRDQTKLEVHESRALKRAFHSVGPHVAVDFHEYRPYRRDFAWFGNQGITNPYDVMFLYSGNLNVPAALRTLTAGTFVAAARDRLEAEGVRTHDYITTRDVHDDIWFNRGSVQSRSSATHFALAHAVSILVEVRGVALGRDNYAGRVMDTFAVAHEVLRTAAAEHEQVHRVLADTVGLPAVVAATQQPTVEKGAIDVIDLATRELLELDVTFRNNLKSKPTLQRARPAAYAVMPEAVAALGEKLELLGLEPERLESAVAVPVERYLVEHVHREPFRYEGAVRQHATVEIEATEATLPAGTVIVRLDRAGANIALEVFEPESPNSFVSFGVLRAKPGEALPVVRLMSLP